MFVLCVDTVLDVIEHNLLLLLDLFPLPLHVQLAQIIQLRKCTNEWLRNMPHVINFPLSLNFCDKLMDVLSGLQTDELFFLLMD